MLILQEDAIRTMAADAESSFPDECCGFFFGEETVNERVIKAVLPVNNSREGDKRRRFEIAAADYLEAELFAVKNKLNLLGVYHSHPNHPAIPSETDRLSAQPYFSYVIISVINGRTDTIRSWALNEERQFEEEIIFDNQLIKI